MYLGRQTSGDKGVRIQEIPYQDHVDAAILLAFAMF
jgi:hypothetical protein